MRLAVMHNLYFYNKLMEKIRTALEEDTFDKFYNKYVEGTDEKDWKSAEHMIEYSRYEYGFTIDYNLEQKPGLGSAIFFHMGDSYTVGCISTKEENVLKYLSLLSKSKNPYILLQQLKLAAQFKEERNIDMPKLWFPNIR